MSGSSSFLPASAISSPFVFLIPSHVPRMSHENLVHAFSEPRCSIKRLLSPMRICPNFFVERDREQDTGKGKLKQGKQSRVWIP